MTEDGEREAEPERDRPDPDAPVNAGPLTCWACRRATIERRGRYWYEAGTDRLHTCAGPEH